MSLTNQEPTRFEIEHGYTPCRHRFGDRACGYNGSAEDCDKTIADCRRHGRLERFGGFPSQSEGVIAARAAKRVAETIERWEDAGRRGCEGSGGDRRMTNDDMAVFGVEATWLRTRMPDRTGETVYYISTAEDVRARSFEHACSKHVLEVGRTTSGEWTLVSVGYATADGRP